MQESNARLNRESPVALYYQLKQIIKSEIENGEYQPGDQLPSENQLARKYGISRQVVRQALKSLVMEGRIISRQGAGYFVNQPRILKQLISPGSHTKSMSRLGRPTQTLVTTQELSEPPRFIAERLLDAKESEAVIIERVSYLDEEPVSLIVTYFPRRFAPLLLNEDLDNQSIYEKLQHEYGIVPERATTTIAVTFADPHQSSLLQIREGSPLIRLGSFTWATNDLLFEYSSIYYRSDRLELETEQTISGDLPPSPSTQEMSDDNSK